MKLIDDKLRIIDDVPTSAVEMAVKEKVCMSLSNNFMGIQIQIMNNLFSNFSF